MIPYSLIPIAAEHGHGAPRPVIGTLRAARSFQNMKTPLLSHDPFWLFFCHLVALKRSV